MEDLRKTIDGIDVKILELMNERFIAARRIGEYKKMNGLPIENREREMQVVARYRSAALDYGADPDILEGICRLLMEQAKRMEV